MRSWYTLKQLTYNVSCYYLYKGDIERAPESTRTVSILTCIKSCYFIAVYTTTSRQGKECLHFILIRVSSTNIIFEWHKDRLSYLFISWCVLPIVITLSQTPNSCLPVSTLIKSSNFEVNTLSRCSNNILQHGGKFTQSYNYINTKQHI